MISWPRSTSGWKSAISSLPGVFTVADICAVVALDFARIIRFRPDKSLENVARWLKAMRERPSAPKA
ncbi:MAG: glutathione binding-like protein [Asticcacaulis sp.]